MNLSEKDISKLRSIALHSREDHFVFPTWGDNWAGYQCHDCGEILQSWVISDNPKLYKEILKQRSAEDILGEKFRPPLSRFERMRGT
jgi:hypothetical protein